MSATIDPYDVRKPPPVMVWGITEEEALVSAQSTGRNEQRRARGFQRTRGIPYIHALPEVRRSTQADGIATEAAAVPMRQAPVEYRFLVSTVEDLRHHGRARAGQEVLRSLAADFFQDRSSSHDRGDLVRLATHGVAHWGISGLRQIEEDELVELARPWLPLHGTQGAGPLEQVVGGWRTTLQSRTEPSPSWLPVRRAGVLETLAALQLGLRAISALSDALDSTPDAVQSAARAADNLGRALSRAFGAGIITAVPQAVNSALRALHNR